MKNYKARMIGIGHYFDYCKAKGDFDKIVNAILFKDYCFEAFYDIKRNASMHDMDLEREFEVLLCKASLIIDKWRGTNSIFSTYRDKLLINKLDTLMNGIYRTYIMILLYL